jgi:hypothetical protein
MTLLTPIRRLVRDVQRDPLDNGRGLAVPPVSAVAVFAWPA